MNNPNRFIKGLSDIGQIVDDNVNPNPVVINGPQKIIIVIPNPDRSLDDNQQIIQE
jgi:hypothetical protein